MEWAGLERDPRLADHAPLFERARFLAALVLDFEPGIHFAQRPMQAGTTGINANRIYSPKKQARDQDPQGVFLRRWLPELEGVSTERHGSRTRPSWQRGHQ